MTDAVTEAVVAALTTEEKNKTNKVNKTDYDIEVFHSCSFGVTKDILKLQQDSNGNLHIQYPSKYPESKNVKIKQLLFGRAKED